MGAPFSVRLATKASFEGKKKSENLNFYATFLRQIWRSTTKKKLSLSDKFGILLLGLDTYFLEVRALS